MKRTLSDDIRLLIDTLGHVLEAQGGKALFSEVETMRLAAKEARDGGDKDGQDARDRLARVAARMDPALALDVTRAFTLYFQLVNLAEDAQRVRELRRREAETGPTSVAESIHAVIQQCAAAGVPKRELIEILREVGVRYVFTAHPTEARRRTTERLLATIRGSLTRRDRCALTAREREDENRGLRARVEALWQHAAERPERPEVLEEVKAGLWYLRHVLLDVAPRFQRRIHQAIQEAYDPTDLGELPVCLSFGSWMGADRDGNPFVDVAVMERTLELHRWIVLDRYASDLTELIDPLAAAAHRLPADPDLDRALARAAAALPEVAAETERRNPHEPIRRLLTFMLTRIQRTRSLAAGGYASAQGLLADLSAIRAALQRAHAQALPEDQLVDLITRVRVFGFHLVHVDVREDSAVHRTVIGELLGDDRYADRSAEERVAALARLELPPSGSTLSAPARRLLAMFDAVRRLQAKFGSDAIGTYVISMTRSVADVLEVWRLAELHGIERSLDIVPLFETPDDLDRAGPLLTALFNQAAYRQHLTRRQNVQEVLVGYSDSMKKGGLLASRARIIEAQHAAAQTCAAHGIKLRMFHGRGGSVSRGGGPTHRAIAALPREGFSGQMKITEQGEMRAYNFANPDLAVRYLEQTVGAAVLARAEARRGAPARPSADRELISRLAETSHQAYRELVGQRALLSYFAEATPFEHISALNIASRPAKRRADELTLDSLRAIPWVFSWSQSRHVLTGWYGVGTALAQVLGEPDGLAELRRLYADSRFFRDLLENVEMSLAKSDLPIAARYAALCTDTKTGEQLLTQIRAEYERTKQAVLTIVEQDQLLDDDVVLQRSIRLRNPYVDPLSYLQIEGLRRLREGPMDADERAAWSRVVRVSIQGIAAGLRHTG